MTEALEMTIKALAPWFGSKRNLAPEIVRELGPHSAYWEVFCGSMAVLLAKEPCVMETVNDLHGDLINLANVLKTEETAVELYSRVSRLLMHEEVFKAAAAEYRKRGNSPAGESADLERAVNYMICSWIGRNGVAGTESYNQGYCLRFTRNGGHAATRWRSVTESIPAWHHRLRAVTILNRNGFELLERIDDVPGTALYLDPPYIDKGATYIHDLKVDDHFRLAKLLRRFKHARVVVSYYDHPALVTMYPTDKWTHRKIEVTKSLVNQGMRDKDGATKVIEVLLLNGPSFVNDEGGLFS